MWSKLFDNESTLYKVGPSQGRAIFKIFVFVNGIFDEDDDDDDIFRLCPKQILCC